MLVLTTPTFVSKFLQIAYHASGLKFILKQKKKQKKVSDNKILLGISILLFCAKESWGLFLSQESFYFKKFVRHKGKGYLEKATLESNRLASNCFHFNFWRVVRHHRYVLVLAERFGFYLSWFLSSTGCVIMGKVFFLKFYFIFCKIGNNSCYLVVIL